MVEVVLRLLVLQPLQLPFGFRSAVRNPVSGCFLFGLPPFGLLACGAEIDDMAHVTLGVDQILLFGANLARFWSGSITPSRRHWNAAIASRDAARNVGGSVAIPLSSGKTRVLERKYYIGAVPAKPRKYCTEYRV